MEQDGGRDNTPFHAIETLSEEEHIRRREALRKMARMAGIGGVSATLLTSRRALASSGE